jgi:hypothetical protein
MPLPPKRQETMFQRIADKLRIGRNSDSKASKDGVTEWMLADPRATPSHWSGF